MKNADGEEYFVVFTYTELPQNFHELALKSITAEIDLSYHYEDEYTDEEMEMLFQALGKNKWNTLNIDTAAKIKSGRAVIDLAASALEDGFFSHTIRVLSKAKVASILNKVKSEEEFSIETEEFLK